jgi:hypothetical protein
VLAEVEDERAEAIAALIERGTIPRPIQRLHRAAELEDVLSQDLHPPCVVIAHQLAAGAQALVALRRRHPTLPMFVTSPSARVDVNEWCLALPARYLPGRLEAADIEVVLRHAEAYERAPLSHLAWLVRRGGGNLKPHEARYAASFLAGEWSPRGPRASSYSVRSRALEHLGTGSLLELLQERIAEWRDFGFGDRAAWRYE